MDSGRAADRLSIVIGLHEERRRPARRHRLRQPEPRLSGHVVLATDVELSGDVPGVDENVDGGRRGTADDDAADREGVAGGDVQETGGGQKTGLFAAASSYSVAAADERS